MKKKVLLALIATLMSFNSYADYNISGFGTVAGGKASGDDKVVHKGLAGYNDEQWSLEPGSFVGIQASIDLHDKVGITVQGLFEGSDDWEGDLTWAFISYDPTDEWRILAGRQLMPHYIYSDSIDVSYAYHWIALPTQVYNAPFNSFNGISSQYTFDFDESSLFTQLIYGAEDEKDSGNDYKDIWGGKIAYNYDWFTLNLGYFEFKESSTNTRPAPGGALETTSQEGVLISYDIGFQIDYNDWLVIAEVTTVDLTDLRDGDSGPGTRQPWMLSVAKRIGDFTPHVTYGEDRELDFNNEDSTSPFYIAGLRWDCYDSIALKVEYIHKENNDGYSAEAYQLAVVAAF